MPELVTAEQAEAYYCSLHPKIEIKYCGDGFGAPWGVDEKFINEEILTNPLGTMRLNFI